MKTIQFNRLTQLFTALAIFVLFIRCQPDEELVPNLSKETIKRDTVIVSDTTLTEDTTFIEDPDTDTVVDVAGVTHMLSDTTHLVDGKVLNIQPGDVIGLQGGVKYGRLKFVNIVGTPDNPITIINVDGVAEIYSKAGYGMKFEYSENFILRGDGSGDQYGIKVTAEMGFFITMEKFTTDFEMYRVEVAGVHQNGIGELNGFAGIGVKTSPYQDCDLFTDPSRTAWIMRNVSIHDNYIHDTGGEGIYMGHGMYAGRKEKDCPSVTYSHSIKGVRIYNNLIEDVGFDGIQIKNADEDVKVYENIVRNYGTRDHGAHNEGLFIGEGTVGEFYNNLIDTGTGSGCQIQGMGDLHIYNNVFANQAGYGIYVAHGSMVIRHPDKPFNIFNNTIYNTGRMAYVFYNGDGGPKRFINNLVVKADEFTKKDATTEMESNIFTNDLGSVAFENPQLHNFRLKNGSVGIDAGIDLRSYGVEEDFEGVARPSGAAFDVGAYEKPKN